MPRRTRAGLKPVVREDDHSDTDRSTPLPETPSRAPRTGREPLGELVNAVNTPQHEANIILEIDLSKPARNSPKKDKPHRSGDKENLHEVLEDACSSEPSPAVEEARYELRKDSGKAASLSPARDVPRTPSSRAALAARKQLLQQEERAGGRPTVTKGAAESHTHDSLRSPTYKAAQGNPPVQERIEDSDEAHDALEDVIEEIGAAISPQLRDSMKQPLEEDASMPQAGAKMSPATHQTEVSTPASTNVTDIAKTRSAGRIQSVPRTNALAAKSARHAQANACATPIRNAAGRRSTSGNHATARPGSLRKGPFMPIRSSKPITTSTFALPGEAVAAKLKAQREEREQRRKSGVATATVRGTSFAGPNNRARPIALDIAKSKATASKSAASLPKTSVQARNVPAVAKPRTSCTTTSSQRRPIRTSSAGTTSTQINGSTRANIKAHIARPPTTLTEIFNPPGPEVIQAHTSPSTSKTPSQHRTVGRNTIGRNTAGRITSTKPASLRTQRPSASSANKHSTAPPPPQAPAKAKAATLGAASGVRARMLVREQAAQERRAREEVGKEAARRARIEAAEKGRLASREWAERQRQRTKAAKAKPMVVDDGKPKDTIVNEGKKDGGAVAVVEEVEMDMDVEVEIGAEKVVVL